MWGKSAAVMGGGMKVFAFSVSLRNGVTSLHLRGSRRAARVVALFTFR
jgi:hypothetical protein